MAYKFSVQTYNLTIMSQLTWGVSQQNKRTLIIDEHDFTKKQTTTTTEHWKWKQQQQLNTGYSSHMCWPNAHFNSWIWNDIYQKPT